MKTFNVIFHYLTGLVAAVLALNYLTSGTLFFDLPNTSIDVRPRAFVVFCFAYAAFCLLFAARARGQWRVLVLGYTFFAIGSFTVWLITDGMDMAPL